MIVKAYAVVSRSEHFPEWKIYKIGMFLSHLAIYTNRTDAWNLVRKLRNEPDPRTREDMKKYRIQFKTVSVNIEKF